uniref:Uncharacterized protein n=1 Tax=Fagus sylvatica TaxID=28930 RepID=A0A2N9IQF2_FAGSY
MNEVYVEPNESFVANEEFSEEEASSEDMDEAHESEGVDVANDEFREEHNEDNLGDRDVNKEASVNMLDLEKDVDVNYDPGLWGIINNTKRLFKHKPMTTSLAEDGTSDWHNLPTKLKDHEKNPEHNHDVVKWVMDLQMRLKLMTHRGLGLFKRLEDTLVDLKLNIDDIRGQSYDNGSNMKEGKGLCNNALEDFEFLISLCIWYKILDKINWVSQVLQKEEIDLENAITKIKELILFFEKFREYGFLDLMEESRELAKKVGIDPEFTIKRVVLRKKKLDEDVGEDANGSQSLEEKFKVTYFYHFIDQALTSLKDRLE